MKTLFMILFVSRSIFGWNNLKQSWRKGIFKSYELKKDNRIQFLSLTQKGKLMYYYDAKTQNVIYNNTVIYNKKYVVDLDIEKWNNSIHHMIAFYDKDRYKVLTSDCLPCYSFSPIKRCVLAETNEHLLGLIVCSNGEIHKINKGIKTNYSSFKVPVSIYQAEYYKPYLYLIDGYHDIHVFCPEEGKIIHTIQLGVPIMHLHVFMNMNEHRMTVGFLNKTVSLFTFADGKIEDERNFNVKLPIKKVFSDLYKTVVVLEDGCVNLYDYDTTEPWYKLNSLTDMNYFTRLYVSHKTLVLDGTDGLKFYQIDSKDIVNKRSPFMEALLKTPLYNTKMSTDINWSHSFNKTG